MASPNKTVQKLESGDQRMFETLDRLDRLHRLSPSVPLDMSEAALFLRMSDTTLQELCAADKGPAPTFKGPDSMGVPKATRLFTVSSLVAWQQACTMPAFFDRIQQTEISFATVESLAARQAFYVDANGLVEAPVEEQLWSDVVAGLGVRKIVWMPALAAAGATWSSASAHRDFARRASEGLSRQGEAVRSALEATELEELVPPGVSVPTEQP